MIAALGFVSIFLLNLPFPLIILAAALWGYVTFKGAAVSIEVTQSPSLARPIRTTAIWLSLWLGPLIVLSLTGQQLLSDLGWFFARLAVVTFGGAYAVLAYMTQTVVDQYHWISTDQMIDALGLAETTPGPLILVTQFVAMLTGQMTGGVTLALAAGAVALWATFVPCFLWIFLAAPYLDRLAARPRLAAALHGITAAVVGVILNPVRVVWPECSFRICLAKIMGTGHSAHPADRHTGFHRAGPDNCCRRIDFSPEIRGGNGIGSDGDRRNCNALYLINPVIRALSFPNKTPMLRATTFEDYTCRKTSTMET